MPAGRCPNLRVPEAFLRIALADWGTAAPGRVADGRAIDQAGL